MKITLPFNFVPKFVVISKYSPTFLNESALSPSVNPGLKGFACSNKFSMSFPASILGSQEYHILVFLGKALLIDHPD